MIPHRLVHLPLTLVLVAASLTLAQYSKPPEPAPEWTEGIAKHYSPGRMLATYRVRVDQGLIEEGSYPADYQGLASTPYCENIGKTLYASFWDPKREGWSSVERFLIADCSRPGSDQARHIANRQTEYDYDTAERHGWEWDGTRGEGKTQVRTWVQP